MKPKVVNLRCYSSHTGSTKHVGPTPTLDSSIKFSGIPGASTLVPVGMHAGEFEPRFLE